MQEKKKRKKVPGDDFLQQMTQTHRRAQHRDEEQRFRVGVERRQSSPSMSESISSG